MITSTPVAPHPARMFASARNMSLVLLLARTVVEHAHLNPGAIDSSCQVLRQQIAPESSPPWYGFARTGLPMRSACPQQCTRAASTRPRPLPTEVAATASTDRSRRRAALSELSARTNDSSRSLPWSARGASHRVLVSGGAVASLREVHLPLWRP